VSQRCPACQGTRTSDFLELGSVPAFCNVQWATREQAQSTTLGPISLTACVDCGHVFNRAFDAGRMTYAPGYENSQHASSVFRSYAERLVSRLIERYGIRGKPVVDIGCGRGDLLALICEHGGNRGFGYDPSYAGRAADGAAYTIHREYFGAAQAAAIRPALVGCRHVLEHVEDPVTFLRGLRDALAASGDAVLYLEVPAGEELLSALGLWDYLYEHVSYFSARSLQAVLHAAGFEVLHMQRDFAGQFLCAEARVAHAGAAGRLTAAAPSEAELRAAATGMTERLQHWRRWASELPADGNCLLWGAGSKGVMFLNLLGLRAPGRIDRVVDQNADKHSRFVSGTGQQIIAPEALREVGVSEVVLMNGIYAEEVRGRLADLGVAPTLTVAWP
jgi:SAM-dependent methyltransferase